jgi:hypothetical protein
VLAVFEGNTADPGKDIMLDATLELVLKNGKELLVEFGARAEVVGEEEEVRLQSFVVYTVSFFFLLLGLVAWGCTDDDRTLRR